MVVAFVVVAMVVVATMLVMVVLKMVFICSDSDSDQQHRTIMTEAIFKKSGTK